MADARSSNRYVAIAGNNSEIIQAQRLEVHSGLSPNEAKELMMSVFEANMLRLRDEAAHLATERAERIVLGLLSSLSDDHDILFDRLREPAVQISVFQAQRENVRAGDTDVERLLIDLLVSIIRVEQKSLREKVLSEALLAVGHLTAAQINILALAFALGHAKISRGVEPDQRQMQALFDLLLAIPLDWVEYQHLSAVRCAENNEIASTLDMVLRQRFGDDWWTVRGAGLLTRELTDRWKESGIGHVRLSTIGMAIGHVSLLDRRITGFELPF